MTEFFVFDGVDCRDFAVSVFDKDTFGAPGRVYQSLSIPGRLGSILIDSRRYENRSQVYSCVIYEDCERNLDDFRNYLLSRTGYKRLEDSIHPEEFYMASCRADFNPIISRDRTMAKIEVAFERKPQRFLKSGEMTTTFTVSGSIMNPTRFPSQPILRVYGAGTVGIGGTNINISQNPTYIDIDCEAMECFTGTVNKNSVVDFSSIDFPVLNEGSTGITLQNGVTKVEVTPRWYRI